MQMLDMFAPAVPKHEPDDNARQPDDFKLGASRLSVPSSAVQKAIANIQCLPLLRGYLDDPSKTVSRKDALELMAFSGWGSVWRLFDPPDDDWAVLRKSLASKLSDDQARSAQASITTSYFTPPFIARAMHDALHWLGVRSGRFLDPAAGTGMFLATALPDVPFDVTAVEPDVTSADILQVLFPRATLLRHKLQDTALRDGTFDVAMTNAPFGQRPVNDGSIPKLLLTGDTKCPQT